MNALEIARTGLDVEWRRLEVITENLANVNTVSKGRPYRMRSLLSGPSADFASYLDHKEPAGGVDVQSLAGVTIYGVQEDNTPPHLVYEPGNPQANADGFVAYPAIDHAGQMTLMIKTSRAYEADIVAMNAARQMYSKALELGRR